MCKALSSIVFKENDVIITTIDDYISNQITFISLQKKLKLKIIRTRNLADHELDLENLENLIKKYNPKLVAVTHIPTNSGLIQNVEGVGKSVGNMAFCILLMLVSLLDRCL
jgi:selenocysteine lyase/cysteine desulfurase